MLNRGRWYWAALVAVSVFSQDAYTVTVKVQSTVVTDQTSAEVILPCEYELENPNQVCNIRWDTDTDVVIVKDTVDQLFFGDKYTGRVKWGEGCSLVLLSPGLNDTDRYQFKMLAPYDHVKSATIYVQLTVQQAEERKTTPGESSTPQSTGPTSAVTPSEDGGSLPVQGLIVHAAFLTIINIVALISQTLIFWNSEQNGYTDTLTRLCLGSPVVLFGIGAVTSVVSMITRSNVATIVSFVALTLGIGIDGVFCIIKMKKSVRRNAKKAKAERQKMYSSSRQSDGCVLLTTKENLKKTDKCDEVRVTQGRIYSDENN